MISLHRLQGAQLSFLSTGHSHEDIDALFSLLRNWLQRHPELWTAESFRACLEEFFENPEARPYERLRKVVLLTQYRDWTKRWMSDGNFNEKAFLYLPASVAQEIAASTAPPGLATRQFHSEGALPYEGPAVGPGARAPQRHMGQNLEAAAG
ncbi:unnamed protein product [Effrenium voratum]|nr:unnamed protein product [Effrenium voratum]